MEVAIFGAGCFWGVQERFDKIPGVTKTTVGYAGGHVENPSYEQVCRGDTGHAEVVRVVFDEEKTSYSVLLETFWVCHNPTLLNQQGPDVGEQYRSIIICTNDAQFRMATSSMEELEKSGIYQAKIKTEICKYCPFYEAEERHQHYFSKKS